MVVAFNLLVRIWGNCLTIHSLPVLFFFLKMEIRLCTLIPLFMPGSVQRVAQQAEMTVAKFFLTSCM